MTKNAASTPLWCMLFLAALAFPTDAAGGTLLYGNLASRLIEASSPSDLQGRLVLFTRGEAGGTEATPAGFDVSAPQIHVRTYSLNPSTNFARAYTAPQRDDQDFTQATVRGLVNRADNQFALFPSPQASFTLHSSCAKVAPSPASQVQLLSQVHERSAPDSTVTAQTATALTWASCGTQAAGQSSDLLTVTGDFVLMLWQWDSEVSANGQTTLLPSGHSRYEHDPIGSPETVTLVSQDRQRYLYVTNGTFTMRLGSDTPAHLYMEGGSTYAAGGFIFRQATGELEYGMRALPVRSSDVAITGDTELRLHGMGVDAPMQTTLAGHPSGIQVGSTAFTPGAPGQTGVWLWGLLGAVLAPAVAIPLRRRRNPRRIQALVDRSMELLLDGQVKEAEAMTAKALDLAPDSAQAQWARARVLAHRQDYAGARAHHERAAALLRQAPDPALLVENALSAAVAGARNPHRDDADVLGWLLAAVRADPALVVDVAFQPELAPYEKAVLDAIKPVSLRL